MYPVRRLDYETGPRVSVLGAFKEKKFCFGFDFFSFQIHMSSTWICVISCVSLTSQPLSTHPSILCGKNFDVRHDTHFLTNSFIPAMCIDTIDLFHFITLSVALPDSHKFSRKENLLASFSRTLFYRLVVVLEQCKLNISILIYANYFVNMGNNCCFSCSTDCTQKFEHWFAFRHL